MKDPLITKTIDELDTDSDCDDSNRISNFVEMKHSNESNILANKSALDLSRGSNKSNRPVKLNRNRNRKYPETSKSSLNVLDCAPMNPKEKSPGPIETVNEPNDVAKEPTAKQKRRKRKINVDPIAVGDTLNLLGEAVINPDPYIRNKKKERTKRKKNS
jgi:hypothetical protein